MNLIQTLDDELRYVKLDDFEKARYIYLRCCEIFSFDARWFYTDVLGDTELHNKILNKTFDLENIDDELVICHSFSRYILKPLLDNLTKLNCRLVNNGSHSFVVMDSYGQEWRLDATLGDMARVKLNLPTKGFDCGISEYDILLDEIDLNLGYSNMTKDDYERRTNGNSFTDSIENIGYILSDSKAKYHFTDMTYLYDMLSIAYNDDPYTYFDKDYNFHRLVEVNGEYSFFDLSKVNGEYKMNKITSNEYKRLSKSLYYK